MGEYRLEQEGIRIETKLPLQTLLLMEVKEGVNTHSRLEIEAIIGEEGKQEILAQNWQGTTLLVTLSEATEACVFFGTLNQLKLMEDNDRMLVRLTAVAETALLDKKKKSRSFQNPHMTYRQILKTIMTDYSSVDCNWGDREEESIQEPIIQYEETDWNFLLRLSSHFYTCLVGRNNGRGTMLSLAAERRKQRQIKEPEIIGWGIGEGHYRNGCYEVGRAPDDSSYLVITTKENWELGDYAEAENTFYQLYEKQAVFRQGELWFTYWLGRPGILYRKKAYNPLLAGISLEGTVRKADGENVYIQLDMDEQEKADYPWKWVPQINHFSYCMPETDTKISLNFSTGQETSGLAVPGKFNRNQSRYSKPQNREFTTFDQKKLGLYPDKLFLEGRDGAVNLTMEDTSGIQMNSKKGITLSASGTIQMNGRQLYITSPVEVVCKTPVSNVALCRDINLFAPGGVQTVGTEEIKGQEKQIRERKRTAGIMSQTDGWQAAYTALAAVPAIDFSQNQAADFAIDILTCASIPRIAGGQTTYTMMEVMEGKNEGDCTFPRVFKSMDNYTVKGGYLLPEEETEV